MKKHQEPTRARIDFFHNGKLRGGATCDGYIPVSQEDSTCKFAPLICQEKDDVMQTIILPQVCGAKPEDVVCKKKPESVALQDEKVVEPATSPASEATPVAAPKPQPVAVLEPQPVIAESQQTLFPEGA